MANKKVVFSFKTMHDPQKYWLFSQERLNIFKNEKIVKKKILKEKWKDSQRKFWISKMQVSA